MWTSCQTGGAAPLPGPGLSCRPGLGAVHYCVQVHLDGAADLLALDRAGTSDPYCTLLQVNTHLLVQHCEHLLQAGRQLHRTATRPRTLTPQARVGNSWGANICDLSQWEEVVETFCQVPPPSLTLRLYDQDRLLSDDFLGEAEVVVEQLEPDRQHRLQLNLQPARDQYLTRSQVVVTG